MSLFKLKHQHLCQLKKEKVRGFMAWRFWRRKPVPNFTRKTASSKHCFCSTTSFNRIHIHITLCHQTGPTKLYCQDSWAYQPVAGNLDLDLVVVEMLMGWWFFLKVAKYPIPACYLKELVKTSIKNQRNSKSHDNFSGNLKKHVFVFGRCSFLRLGPILKCSYINAFKTSSLQKIKLSLHIIFYPYK